MKRVVSYSFSLSSSLLVEVILCLANSFTYYNALEWKRKVFTDLESGAACRAARYVCGAVLVYDGHLAPKVQADGFFDFATPVEELFK